jgi:hypothetical protein
LGEEDAISAKKCAIEIAQIHSVALKDFSEEKYKSTPLKKVA